MQNGAILSAILWLGLCIGYGKWQTEKGKKMPDEWNIKKPGGVGVVSSIPLCGYDKATLASLKKAGYRIYRNGKLCKEKENEKNSNTI